MPAYGHSEWMHDTMLGGGARSLSMGEGGAAVIEGVEGLYWSPANIAWGVDTEILLGKTNWIADNNQQTAAIQRPMGGYGVFGATLNMQAISDFETRDANGELTGKDSWMTGQVGVSWAHVLGATLAGGVSVGYKMQDGLGVGKKGMALGLGITRKTGDFCLGVSAMDLALVQPAYQFSGSWTYSKSNQAITLNGGGILRDGENRLGCGIEACTGKMLRLRAGYMVPIELNGLKSFSNLTAGLGIVFGRFEFDYAFVPLGELGQVHRFQFINLIPGDIHRNATY